MTKLIFYGILNIIIQVITMILTIKRVAVVAIASILFLLFFASYAFANHAWGNYHWARTTPTFTVQVKNSMSYHWQSSLKGAVVDWNKSAVVDFALKAQKRSRSCLGVNGMVEVCNDAYGSNGWLGIAEIWVNGDHITKGTVKLNDTYYNTPTYNTVAWRKAVVCQEIGHTLGLGHNDEDFNTTKGTCMDYSYNPVPNQHPDVHDYEMLATMYAHLDTFDSYTKTGVLSSNSGAKTLSESVEKETGHSKPSTWGEVVKRDAKNNPSLYARKATSGEMVFTHVTWIPEYDGHEDHEHDHAE